MSPPKLVSELHLSHVDSHRLERLIEVQEDIACALMAILFTMRADKRMQADVDAMTARLKKSSDKLAAAAQPEIKE